MQRVDLSKHLVNKKIFDGVTVTLTQSYNRCYLSIYFVCALACVCTFLWLVVLVVAVAAMAMGRWQ